MKQVLIISPHPEGCYVLTACLEPTRKVTHCPNLESALTHFSDRQIEIVFWDLDTVSESESALSMGDYVRSIFSASPNSILVLLTAEHNLDKALEAIRSGAHDRLSFPLVPREVDLVLAGVNRDRRRVMELEYLRTEAFEPDQELLETKNPAMTKVVEQLLSVAPTKTNVLLIGETGVGKGVLARALHRHSARKGGPFVAVHCGAIPEGLVDSEFFGHEKGAFTGAVRQRLGKFEIARGGTIFLDEIGTIAPAVQVRLLRVLQDQLFERVGGETSIQADVRVVSASNVDLKQMADDGMFRQDLYYRLNVFPIAIPSLRERREDIPSIANRLLRRLNDSHLKTIEAFHPLVLDAFESYPWPGNVRELENVIERAYVLEKTSVFMPESFPSEIFAFKSHSPGSEIAQSLTLAEARSQGVASIERMYLSDVLNKNKGRIKDSANAAGISSRQLHKLMKKYELRKEAFRNRNS